MRTAKIWEVPTKVLMTATLSAALIVSGSGFTTAPETEPVPAAFTPTAPDTGRGRQCRAQTQPPPPLCRT